MQLSGYRNIVTRTMPRRLSMPKWLMDYCKSLLNIFAWILVVVLFVAVFFTPVAALLFTFAKWTQGFAYSHHPNEWWIGILVVLFLSIFWYTAVYMAFIKEDHGPVKVRF